MLFAYHEAGGRLAQEAQAPHGAALWIDLYRPTGAEVAELASLGVEVPTLEDMEEIEISSRLYREDGVDYITVVLPGLSESQSPLSGPVTFILSPRRLVTVRHHTPRPFETYPARADKVGPGCTSPERIFLGLMEEIVGRLADLLEGAGKALDQVTRSVFDPETAGRPSLLQDALRNVGREGDLVGRVRLGLLTMERAIGFLSQSLADRPGSESLRPVIKALTRDIQALEVHADFVASRVALASDATLGMINLAQNTTVRIVSVVAVLFLPPTLIASVYGMNFRLMPELDQSWGYPMALGLMLASALGTYLFFKWKNWL
jgi:magnesium transporter